MSTEVEIILCGPNEEALEKAAASAFSVMEQIERDFSVGGGSSKIKEINKFAGLKPVKVGPDLFVLIQKSISFSHLSNGCFDISTQGLGNLWDFRAPTFVVPEGEVVNRCLNLVDYRKIRLDRETSSVILEQKGMRISVGGIGKGYAVDKAVEAVRVFGIKDGIINAGGDLKAFGRKENGELWKVAIKNPRDQDRIMCVIPLSNVALATSGDYERYRIVGGKRYHHLLDPRTGYPAVGCMSATVIAKDALEADALATAVFVMGPRDGLNLVESLPGVEGVVVDITGKLKSSMGLATLEEQ